MELFLQDVADFFALGRIATFEKSVFGNANTTYLVRMADNSEYAIRVLGVRTNALLLENERYVQEKIAKEGVQTTRMISSADGAFVFEKYGKRATVSKLIQGRHPIYPVALNECELIGRTLAYFHNSLLDSELPHPEVESTLNRQRVDRGVKALPETGYAERMVELLSLSAIDNETLPSGIIHGDFHINNLLKDGDNIFILDLQEVGMGPLILDVGRSIADVCCDGDKLDMAKLRSFLAGYEAIRPLQLAERGVVNKAIQYGAVAASLSLYEDHNQDFAYHFLDLGYTVPSSL